MKYNVPFVPNTPDDLNCLQAAYMMIARYFDPDFSIQMSEWSEITGFEPGKGTWANAGLVWFIEHGYDVKHMQIFDFERFLAEPEQYLIEFAGEEVGQWQIEHTNIPAEQERIKKLLATGIVERRIPTIEDITRSLGEGYLLRAMVNMNKLNGSSGYVGHAVTIIGYDDDTIFLHDPGYPPVEKRAVSFKDFEAAWADPNEKAKELDAIKLKK